MGRNLRRLLVLALALGLVGCQSVRVRSDWDPVVSFSGLQHYYWFEPPVREAANPFADNTLLRNRVRTSMQEALARRGFRAQESRAEADFLVTYHVVLAEHVDVETFALSSNNFRHRHHAFATVHSLSRGDAFQESTLIIDFLDPKSDDLVWRGWASGILATRDRNRGADVLNRGIQAILDVFPPDQ